MYILGNIVNTENTVNVLESQKQDREERKQNNMGVNLSQTSLT